MLKQSTARNMMVLMTDSADHITGATGKTLTITASKNGAAFASISPTVTERGSGWYSMALTTSHTDTLGDFVGHVTASGCDPTDFREEVVIALPGESNSDVIAIKAKTDSLTFTVAGAVDSNITHVIADPVKLSSSKTTNWGGT